jgi:chromosome segregation ATPase
MVCGNCPSLDNRIRELESKVNTLETKLQVMRVDYQHTERELRDTERKKDDYRSEGRQQVQEIQRLNRESDELRSVLSRVK